MFLIQVFIRCSLLSGAVLFKENTALIEKTTARESTTSFEGPLTWPLVWGVTHLPRPEAEEEVLGTRFGNEARKYRIIFFLVFFVGFEFLSLAFSLPPSLS